MKITFKKGKLTLEKDGEITDKEVVEKKRRFFVDFFANLGMATLISYGVVYIYLPVLGESFLLPLRNFFASNIVFAVLVCWRFFTLGKNEFVINRARGRQFVVCALPTWLIYAAAYVAYHLPTLFMPNRYYGKNLSGDGIYALALLFIGEDKRSVTAQSLLFEPRHGWVSPDGLLPNVFIAALIASFILHAIVFTLLAYAFYKTGINERDIERRDVLAGTDVAYERAERWRFYSCFIPFMNYYPIYSWTYEYFVNPVPERKQKYFWRGVLLIVLGMTGIELLRYVFYLICPVEWINAVLFYLSLHFVGVVISLVAYYDNKRHEKLFKEQNEIKKDE
ncbi:MAG: hypothetical protein IJX55_06230 [Clostridia bacterium]|nr:hypothetical protein [Clostridia bacterium]